MSTTSVVGRDRVMYENTKQKTKWVDTMRMSGEWYWSKSKPTTGSAAIR
jgi:hypothetical protein